MPFRTDNALATAATVISRPQEYDPGARVHELWGHHVAALDLADEDLRRRLLDPAAMDQELSAMPDLGIARHLHAYSHTTFSCNVIRWEEHTPELQSLMRISSAVFCLNNKQHD